MNDDGKFSDWASITFDIAAAIQASRLDKRSLVDSARNIVSDHNPTLAVVVCLLALDAIAHNPDEIADALGLASMMFGELAVSQ